MSGAFTIIPNVATIITNAILTNDLILDSKDKNDAPSLAHQGSCTGIMEETS
jgi:hypothetical protein